MKKIGLVTQNASYEEKLKRKARAEVEVTKIPPLGYLKDLVDKIMEKQVDALIVGHDLKNGVGIFYTGAEVVKRVEEEKEGIPLFLVAAKGSIHEAEKEVHNVHCVYGEEQVFANVERFLERIGTQIEKEKQKIQAQEARLMQLMQRSHSLSAQEESEVNALNFSLEKSMDKRKAKDLSAITSSHQKKLENILTKTDAILNALNK